MHATLWELRELAGMPDRVLPAISRNGGVEAAVAFVSQHTL
jgi:hypothetical protein